MSSKICRKCLIEKETTFFSKNKSTTDGLHYQCKECDKKKYYENREANILKMREYKKNNLEKIREYYNKNKENYKDYRKKNREKILDYLNNYYHNNKDKRKMYIIENEDKIKEKRKIYLEKNKQVISEKSKNYRKKNKEKISDSYKKYRKKNLTKELERVKEYYEKNKKTIIKNSVQRKLELRRNNPLERLKHNLSTRISSCLKRKNVNKNNRTSEFLGCSPKELKEHLEKKFSSGMTWENYGKWHVDHKIPLASAKNEEELYNLFHYTNLQPMWAEENQKKGAKIIF